MKVFTKLDLNMAFHQVELHPESRDVTTFATPNGVYRYKRLVFGLNMASEKFNHIIRQVAQDCPGAFFDDHHPRRSHRWRCGWRPTRRASVGGREEVCRKRTYIQLRETEFQSKEDQFHGTYNVRQRSACNRKQT